MNLVSYKFSGVLIFTTSHNIVILFWMIENLLHYKICEIIAFEKIKQKSIYK